MSRTARRGGFTLAEILVALGVLVPVVVVTLGILPYSHLIDRRAWSVGQAQDVAAARLEGARSLDFDALPASEEFVEERDGVSYRGTVTTTVLDASSPALLKRVSVTVVWTMQGEQRLTLDTILVRTDR